MPKPPVVRDVESTTVFVGGISYFTNEERLAEVFKDCGEIKDIRMPLNEEQTRVNYCFVFVICNRIVALPMSSSPTPHQWIRPCS